MSRKRRRRSPPPAARRGAAGRPAQPAATRSEIPWRALAAAAAIVATMAIGVVVVVVVLRGSQGSHRASAGAATASRLGTAPPLRPGTGQAVDGITCDRQEQVLFHIHAQL